MSLSLDHIKRVYLVGIGGIGMSGLARYFNHLGCTVYGYDRVCSELTLALEKEGISVCYDDDVISIPKVLLETSDASLVIYTPAVPHDLKIKKKLETVGHRLYKRSEVLGLISKDRYTIAVAGTHGKTTTSTMIAHILTHSGFDCSAFLGGISANYNSNVLYGSNNVVVVEADEYDRSFLTLSPDIAVVTSLQPDHLDIYGSYEAIVDSFREFLSKVKEGGRAIVKAGLPVRGEYSYDLEGIEADVYAQSIELRGDQFYFTYKSKFGEIQELVLGISGLHNIENALAAITISKILGIEDNKIAKALVEFKGVKRRFEYVVKNVNTIYIDDYAHHPEEIRSFLTSVKRLYPHKKLTAVFQPHLFTRTRDFVDDFAEVLGIADELLLLDIYPAREQPIEGVTSGWLLDQVDIAEKRLVSKEELSHIIQIEEPELIVTMGAGDIDRLVNPIKKILLSNG